MNKFNLYYIPFDTMIHVTKDNINDYYYKYEKWYNEKLKPKGIKKVTKTSKTGFSLLTLMANSKFFGGKELSLHGDHIKESFTIYKGTPQKEPQLRHFSSQYGYQTTSLTKGYRLLISLEPDPDFFIARRESLDDNNWGELKLAFNYRCATCGSKEGKKGYKRKAKAITKLEQGHMDPRLQLTMDNCVPQCRYCNGIAKNKFIFDEDGNVKEQIN